MHLKKGPSGHLLKNSAGHLANTCSSITNYKYVECHDEECDCPTPGKSTIYLTMSWTGPEIKRSFFPNLATCGYWYNGERKEICPDHYTYTPTSGSVLGRETWRKSGTGTNPGIFLRLGNIPDGLVGSTGSCSYIYGNVRYVSFRDFEDKIILRKLGTVSSYNTINYTTGIKTCDIDPTSFTLNTTNVRLQDEFFGSVTVQEVNYTTTYKWERGNETPPTYLEKVFASYQGETVKIGSTCYQYEEETTNSVTAVPGDIDETYIDCNSCRYNFIYKKCTSCVCNQENEFPTIYVTLSWDDSFSTDSTIDLNIISETSGTCTFGNGVRKEVCAFRYLNQQTSFYNEYNKTVNPTSGIQGEIWEGFFGIALKKIKSFFTSYYYGAVSNFDMTALVNVGIHALTANWNKTWNSYGGSNSYTGYTSNISTDNINLSTWSAVSTPLTINKQFGHMTSVDGITIKWERGRFWDGYVSETEYVFDQNQGNVIMIDGECYQIVRIDETTVNSSPSIVQESYETCDLCNLESSSTSSESM